MWFHFNKYFFYNFNPDIISNNSIYQEPIGKHATYQMIKYYLMSISKNIQKDFERYINYKSVHFHQLDKNDI